MATPKNPTEAALEDLGEPHEFVIPRENDRDLKFSGWLIANEQDGQESSGVTFKTAVSIFATKGGRIVTAVRRWREKEGKLVSEKHTAGVHVLPYEVIHWLKSDNQLVLGALSKRAWVAACHAYPKLKDEEFEQVE